MELIKVNPEQFGLSEIQATTIANKFLPVLEEMQPLMQKYDEIKMLDPADTTNSKQFDDLRKKLVKVRTNCAKIHKDEKAYYLAGGKYVDSWKNKQLEITEPIEADLKEKADYIEIQEQKRKNALIDERLAELQIFETDGSMMNLGEMSDEMYDAVLTGAKAKREQRIKEQKELEEANAKKAKYDEEIQQEEMIWALYYQRIADKEEAEYQAKLAEQKRISDEVEAKAKVEFEASEKIRLAELAQKQAEEKAASDIQKAKDEAEKEIKAAADKAEADRKEAERQAEIKAENERKAEAEKQRLATLAPDKEKAKKYIEELRAVKFPEFTTDEYIKRKPKFGNLMTMAIKELIGE
jgi:hypothetical protein